MKYNKGTFLVIPNKEYLKGMKPQVQTTFFWICEHSDENGICYPSRNKLAKEVGVGIKIIDRAIKELEDKNLIKKTTRKKENSKENMSNLYQIMILGDVENDPTLVSEITLPSVENDPTPRDKTDIVTVSNNNSIHITQEILHHNRPTLPLHRGKTRAMRLLSIYCHLFKEKFGVEAKMNIGFANKIFNELCNSYSEVQVALLLIVYFNWAGMNGADMKESDYLSGQTYPLPLFKSGISKYEVYIRNIERVKFDDDEEVLLQVAKYFKK
jgi:hypothetical protein